MDTTTAELAIVRKRISETMAEVAEKQQELNEILHLAEGIKPESRDQMAKSASSSRRRRKKGPTRTIDNEEAFYEGRRVELEQALGRMWAKIHELQEHETKLENELRGAKTL